MSFGSNFDGSLNVANILVNFCCELFWICDQLYDLLIIALTYGMYFDT